MSMFFLAGAAASSALDLISTLQQTLTPKTSGNPVVQAFDPAAGAGPSATSASAAAPSAPVAPGTMNTLLSVQGQPGLVNGDAFSKQLFSLLDGNGDGTISKSEFEATIGRNGKTAQADSIFSRLDTNGDGSVSQSELTSALQNASQAHRHHHGHHPDVEAADASASGASGGAGSSPSSPSSNNPLTQSDTSQTVTNADGSSTTTITYGDGSQVTMTTPATASDTNLHHFLERLIQRQAQMLATSTPGQALAMSV
jgi:EF-hand domain pair